MTLHQRLVVIAGAASSLVDFFDQAISKFQTLVVSELFPLVVIGVILETDRN